MSIMFSTSRFVPIALVYAALLAGICWQLLTFLPAIMAGQIVQFSWPWVSELGIHLSFRLDGLAMLFALLISAIGVLIFVYSARYMLGYPQLRYFFACLFAFALSMLGVVLADDLVVLFVFWELTTLTSYLLISYQFRSEVARRNSLQALLVTASTGLVLLAAFVLLWQETGTTNLTEIIASGSVLAESTLLLPIVLCVIVGAFGKSAQWPFHFWLPSAMAAPTPVSAYLHSATMVKAGIYLLARFQPLLGNHEVWFWALAICGSITAIWASLLAIKQTDLKQMLAYTTLMALGTLTLLLAVPHPSFFLAAMLFLVIHACYKAALFMVVGIIDLQTGTRDITKLSGLGSLMPITFAAALLAALSMAGLPPFLGFVGKELMTESALHLMPYLLPVMFIANALMVGAAFLIGWRIFVRPPLEGGQMKQGKAAAESGGVAGRLPIIPPPLRALLTLALSCPPSRGGQESALHHDPLPFMWLPPMLLAAAGLCFGLMPDMLGQSLLYTTLPTLIDTPHLALWHGLTPALGISAIVVLTGWLIAHNVKKVTRVINGIVRAFPFNMNALYDWKMDAIERVGAQLIARIDDQPLSRIIRMWWLFMIALLGGLLLKTHAIATLIPSFPKAPDWIGVGLSLLIFAGAFTLIRANSKIMGLAALGASGYAVAGIFLLYGALDVAMTQLLVETLVVILAAAVLWRLPDLSTMTDLEPLWRRRDAIIGLTGGLIVTATLLSVLQAPLDLSLTHFFENASKPLAHGANIVNVILVDFRAIDTLGEITVVACACLGVWALLTREEKAKKNV